MSTMQSFGKSALRVAKNYTKGYSDVQAKVREATSNDPWGPSGTQMNELAQLSYNQNDFVEIMEMLDKRLNDKGKNWRHVFKALTLLDYLLHAGSDNVCLYFRDNMYIVKTLKEFQYVDEDGKDQGANVRQKAKDITNLLQDEGRLKDERRNRASMRDRMTGRGRAGESGYGADEAAELGLGEGGYGTAGRRSRSTPPNRRGRGDDDADLQRAMEASLRSAQDEQERIKRQSKEEDDLARALALSKAEEEKRKAEAESATERALFDDNSQLWAPNAYNQQQPQQVDFFGNPIPTQPTGFPVQQPQQTGFLVDVSGGQQQQLQPQFTSFNPYAQQQQQEQWALQQQQQQQAEWARQQQLLQAQQQAALQQQQQSQFLSPQFTASPLRPQQTGYRSNNPFAASLGAPGTSPSPSTAIASPHPATPPVPAIPSSFGIHSTDAQSPDFTVPPPRAGSAPAPSRSPVQGILKNKDHGQNAAKLDQLLASGEGQDTFGNTGILRIPTGAAFASSRLPSQRTGLPPQSTGSPWGQPSGSNFAPNNPFGQPQQQQQQNGFGGAFSPQPQPQQQGQNNDQPFFSI